MSTAIGKLFGFCYRRAGLVWVLLLAVTAVAVCVALGRVPYVSFDGAEGAGWLRWRSLEGGGLRLSVSSEGLVPHDSPLRERYEEVKRTFGSDHVAAVYAEDPELFTYPKLEQLQYVAEALADLEITLPGAAALVGAEPDSPAADPRAPGTFHPVERVESIFNTSTIRSQGDLSPGPLFDPIPDTPETLAAATAQALRNPLFVRTLVAPDGKATLISLYLRPEFVHLDGYDAALTAAIAAVIAQPEETPDDGGEDAPVRFAQLYQVGSPIMHVTLAGYILEDQAKLIPLSCLVLVLMLAVTLRSGAGAIAPLINAALASAWMLGAMAWCGLPLNMLNYIVPALLVVIGATSDVHIVIDFRDLRAEGKSGLEALRECGRKLGLSLVLTNVTTILGFASTALTDIAVLREFGLAAALGMTMRFLTTLLALPAYLRCTTRFFPGAAPTPAAAVEDAAAPPHGAPDTWLNRRLREPYVRMTMDELVRHPRKVALFALLFAVPALWLCADIRLSNDFSAFLRPDTPVMRDLNRVSRELSGTDVLYVTFRGLPGEYRQPDRLKQLLRLEDYLRRTPGVDSVTGLPDIIALMNREIPVGERASFSIPDNPRLISEYLLLLNPAETRPYAKRDYSQVNLVVRSSLHDSTKLNELIAHLHDTLAGGQFGPQVFSITGHAALTAAAVDQIAVGQVLSLGSMVAILLGLIAVLFLSLRVAALAVVTNLFPIVVVFGVMGLFGVPLNLGTCMIAAISIGIAVDDTVHLMVRYNSILRRLKDERPALRETLREEFQPVVLSSLALGGGFAVLASSSFVPVQQFGLLSALVMVLAILSELVLTPTFLASTRLITVWDVIDLKLRRTLQKDSPVFAGLTNFQIKRLIAASNLENRPAGDYLIRAGETGDRMYVVLEGEIEISRGHGPARIVINRVGPGSVTGEVALVASVKRSADVSAVTPVKLLALDWKELTALQRFSPYLAARLNFNLARILGLRLADTLGKIQTHSPHTHPAFPPAADTPGNKA